MAEEWAIARFGLRILLEDCLKDHWDDYQSRWHLLEPPLRPHQDVVDAIVAAVGEQSSDVLLLGVTPELVERFEHLTAVDKSAEMIDALWRPSRSTQRVHHANWLEMNDSFGSFSAAVGDGSINVLQSANEIDTLVDVVNARLVDGGTFACRVFERPDEPFTEEYLRASLDNATHGNFHAFKWQIAMALAEQSGAWVKVTDVLSSFNRLFADRQRVAEQTGWPLDVINTIDVYERSDMSLCFPNRQELEQHFSRGFREFQWLPSGTYDLAERCPIVLAKT
jgi:hypothetical protein